MALYATSSSCDLGSIIQLYPEEEPRCAGFAPSKGRRCECQTNAANRRAACSLLRRGTRELEQGLDIDDLLDELAPLVLCTRWHQDQWSDLSNRWVQKVEAFRRAASRSTTPIRSSSHISSSSSTLGDSESYYSGRHRSPSSDVCNTERLRDLLQSLNARLEQMEQTLEIFDDTSANLARRTENVTRSISERISQREASATTVTSGTIDHVSSTSSTISPSSTRESSTDARSTSQTLEGDSASSTAIRRPTSTTTTQEASRHTTDSTETRSASSSVPRSAPSTTTESRSNTTTTSATHTSSPVTVSLVRVPSISININETTSTRRTVTQRPIEGQCSICTDPLICTSHEDTNHDHSSSEDEISWCRAQCGNNYHKECLDQWLSTCRDMSRNPTCPYCRAQWVE